MSDSIEGSVGALVVILGFGYFLWCLAKKSFTPWKAPAVGRAKVLKGGAQMLPYYDPSKETVSLIVP